MGRLSPAEAYATVRAELGAYGAGLAELPEIVFFSKLDLLPPDGADEWVARASRVDWRRGLAVPRRLVGDGGGHRVTGARAFRGGAGVGARSRLPRAARHEYEAEHMTYRPAADQGFEIVRENEAFRVVGKGIELLVARHDLSNLEALAYLEDRLREIGVIAALERAGFEPGDDVRIGEEEFELHPG